MKHLLKIIYAAAIITLLLLSQMIQRPIMAYASQQSTPVVRTHFTRWHIPDLCYGERDYQKCYPSYALTADDTILYAFIYQTSTLYQFTTSDTPRIYDVSKVLPQLTPFPVITPIGGDFVLFRLENGIYKYHLSDQTASKMLDGKQGDVTPCGRPSVMKSSGLLPVCLKTKSDKTKLGLLNPFTEQWNVIAENAADTVVVLAGQDNKIYMQLSIDYAAYSYSKLAVTEATYRTLADGKWIAHRLEIKQFRDWSDVHFLLVPGTLDVFLTAVDTNANTYFSVNWIEQQGNNSPNDSIRPKFHFDLFKLDTSGNLVWYLPDSPVRILDVSSDGSLIVAQQNTDTATTDIKWISIHPSM